MHPEDRDGPLVCRITTENFGPEQLDTEGGRYRDQVRLTFTGWHTFRYAFTDAEGGPVLVSEHGLGELVDEDGERLSSEYIGSALAWLAGLGPDPGGLDRPRLVIQAASRPSLSEAFYGRPDRLLPAWAPMVLGFEHNEELPGIGERMLVALHGSGFDAARARWRVYGTGEAVSRPVLQAIREYLRRYARTPEAGTVDAEGRPCGPTTTGALIPRPTVALGLRRIGKVSLDVGVWRPGRARRPKVLDEGERTSDAHERAPERRFREALRVLRRCIAAGERIAAITPSGERVPSEAVAQALATRTAPTPIRQALISAAEAVSRARDHGARHPTVCSCQAATSTRAGQAICSA